MRCRDRLRLGALREMNWFRAANSLRVKIGLCVGFTIIILYYFSMKFAIAVASRRQIGIVTPFIPVTKQVRRNYKLLFLHTDKKIPTLTNEEGAMVFAKRNCRNLCFITNNKGFIPMSQYDAHIYDHRLLLKNATLSSAISGDSVSNKSNTFVAIISPQCIGAKFLNCEEEPVLAALHILKTGATKVDRYNLDLYRLCEYLHVAR